MAEVNIGDVIGTLIYLLFMILFIAFVFLVFKRLINSGKQSQIINQKLDDILRKLEDQKATITTRVIKIDKSNMLYSLLVRTIVNQTHN
ncbi:hypothetical protein CSE16_07665 [Solibacillus sp. R5-41]|uniref:hypothetical protein n=1 Tax=Solibacillus sp. R5-41 TaxID=2048654 RepID=UPI000C126754|nr:hypothetical protein [Solibacillus sp. R5-41]ATP39937.1 hypothetical protein CSE16_07665 [Solibacillus sp. R5-41]